MQSQPAPIVRSDPSAQTDSYSPGLRDPHPIRRYRTPQVTNSQIAPGIFLRSNAQTAFEHVSSTDPTHVELRLSAGVADLSVRHPEDRPQILVDLPGGQTAILKDGFYTFNAGTNTVRVLKGEAAAYPGSKPDTKPVKVKEDHALAFTSPNARSMEFDPAQAGADILPDGQRGEGDYAAQPRGSGYGPYGDGFYGYGYPYGWGGPFGWDYPYGYGYPFGFGIGFGYFGGFGGFGGRGFRR